MGEVDYLNPIDLDSTLESDFAALLLTNIPAPPCAAPQSFLQADGAISFLPKDFHNVVSGSAYLQKHPYVCVMHLVQ